MFEKLQILKYNWRKSVVSFSALNSMAAEEGELFDDESIAAFMRADADGDDYEAVVMPILSSEQDSC